MFVADFLYVNHIKNSSILLSIMLTKDKYLTSRLTFAHFLTLNYERRKKTGSGEAQSVFTGHKQNKNK